MHDTSIFARSGFLVRLQSHSPPRPYDQLRATLYALFQEASWNNVPAAPGLRQLRDARILECTHFVERIEAALRAYSARFWMARQDTTAQHQQQRFATSTPVLLRSPALHLSAHSPTQGPAAGPTIPAHVIIGGASAAAASGNLSGALNLAASMSDVQVQAPALPQQAPALSLSKSITGGVAECAALLIPATAGGNSPSDIVRAIAVEVGRLSPLASVWIRLEDIAHRFGVAASVLAQVREGGGERRRY
jgi:hypothetical protein